jgi:hypothetical protein
MQGICIQVGLKAADLRLIEELRQLGQRKRAA